MQEWDSEDEEEELGMAARTLLTSIPRHRLKALESMEADAKETNAAVKVALSAVHRGKKGILSALGWNSSGAIAHTVKWRLLSIVAEARRVTSAAQPGVPMS